MEGLHYFTGGVIREYNLLLFFCGMIIVYILAEAFFIPFWAHRHQQSAVQAFAEGCGSSGVMQCEEF